MLELALDDVDRHPPAGELDSVPVPKLERREPTTNTGLGSKRAQLTADSRRRPRPPAGRAVDDAKQRPDRELDTLLNPAVQNSTA